MRLLEKTKKEVAGLCRHISDQYSRYCNWSAGAGWTVPERDRLCPKVDKFYKEE